MSRVTRQPDRRSARTQRALREAMVRLLKRSCYEHITVRDILAEADVGRSTFYAHCAGKEPLLRLSLRLMRQELSAGRSRVMGAGGPHGPMSFSLPLLRHGSRNVALLMKERQLPDRTCAADTAISPVMRLRPCERATSSRGHCCSFRPPPLTGRALAACALGRIAGLPVTMDGPLPTTTVKLNGQDTPLVVDSSARFTLLSPQTATSVHLRQVRGAPDDTIMLDGVGGAMPVSLTAVETLMLGTTALPGRQLKVGGPGMGKGGLLGEDLLTAGDVEYDLAGGAIRLWLPDGCGGRAPPRVQGDYAGAIGLLRLALHVTAAADGTPRCTLGSLDQRAHGLPCQDLHLQADTLSFTVPGVGGRWQGTISRGGAVLAGTWTQQRSWPLLFTRATPAEPESGRCRHARLLGRHGTRGGLHPCHQSAQQRAALHHR